MSPSPPNIYIIGAQSTGKTTLVTALSEHFRQSSSLYALAKEPYQIKETARNVLKQQYFTASDITNSKIRALELQRLIIEAQAAAETELGETWYISDRSALDAVVYAQQYVGATEAGDLQQEAAWDGIVRRMKAGVVILCEPNAKWLIDDGVRLMPRDQSEWLKLHSHFSDLLAGNGIEYTVLPSSIAQLTERVNLVVDQWNRKRVGSK
ncbi:MAG: hypothetical protein Q9194_006409 [Teloschistes cf. exilis]